MLDRFEYMSRPLTTETTPADLDELGAEGWELCGVVGGYGWFKRSRIARALQEQGERQAAERRTSYAAFSAATGDRSAPQ